ncbi:MAG TPA: hypothetical protein ENH55_08845 [Aurantimonas coralicida]|uniref:Carboxypeptidase regulatory-like domain-containing protein n=2 Tax=root TaxID=1 RepID=A0A9C9TFK8_9HYPH|nr:hypothetical protein [Aurantimonas coralicida]HET99414.1 hypothetical protein [Aurantimonas coralicida]
MPKSFYSSSVCRSDPITIVIALVSSLHASPAPAGELFGDIMALPNAEPATVSAPVSAGDSVTANGATSAPIGKVDIPKGVELKPLSNQLIELCSVTGNTCESQVTDSTGYYQFDDVKGGTYRLQTLGSDGALLKNEITVPSDTFKELRILAR